MSVAVARTAFLAVTIAACAVVWVSGQRQPLAEQYAQISREIYLEAPLPPGVTRSAPKRRSRFGGPTVIDAVQRPGLD